MHDISKAEPVYDASNTLIGYIFKIAEDLWLPLDLTGENYTGPTYKKDAQDIVGMKHRASTDTSSEIHKPEST